MIVSGSLFPIVLKILDITITVILRHIVGRVHILNLGILLTHTVIHVVTLLLEARLRHGVCLQALLTSVVCFEAAISRRVHP